MICNSERITEGPVLLLNIKKIDFWGFFKCLSQTLGTEYQVELPSIIMIKKMKDHHWKKTSCVYNPMLEENTQPHKIA